MKRIHSAVFLFLFFMLFPARCFAGAWCAPQGAFYGKLSINRYTTDKTFTSSGSQDHLANGGKFYDTNMTFYGEYGLLERLTLSCSLPYKWLRSSSWNTYTEDDVEKRQYNATHYTGPGDVETGLKLGLIKEPFVGSVQFLYKNAGMYTHREKILPGNNQSDYELRLLAGKSLWPFPGYCGLEAGYRFRSKAPSDEFKYLIEFGMDLFGPLSLRVKLDGTKSMHNARRFSTPKPSRSAYVDYETGQVIATSPSDAAGQASSSNPSLGLQYDLGKLETALCLKLTKSWFTEVSYTAYPYGKNISGGQQYSFAIVYYFEPKKEK
jgi:protein XagA